MSPSHGKFVWCELMTTDTGAAQAFYGKVVGWTAQDSGVPGMAYTVLSAGKVGVGGIMDVPPPVRAAGGPPAWVGYVFVDDVDASLAEITAAGGGVLRAASDIPQVGRIAVASDPQGAVFALIHGTSSMEPPPEAGATPGRVGWHELHAADAQAAFAFYAKQFGWTRSGEHDMGPMGIYLIFATGGSQAGGMFTAKGEAPGPFWLYYFNVEEINAAVGRVKEAGGKVLNGPMQVPGGSWIAQCMDPQGAMFALHSAGVGQA
jgi:predicted enzyme related to lactoylglutathione lyase